MSAPDKVIVLGASGFVGTTLTERLLRQGVKVVPVIHSAGSAWLLARHAMPLQQLDILDKTALSTLMKGATHVVNCTRGQRPVMIDGLQRVLAACTEAGVKRFVHLSSVMVYGDPPHADSSREDAPTTTDKNPDSYARQKLEQDQMVQAAARMLPSVVLCPPNISGPFSGYLAGIVKALRGEQFAFVDGGVGPCNLVDVRNLCHAIELALRAPEGEATSGRRLFVTDGAAPSWKTVIAELEPIVASRAIRQLSRAQVEQLAVSPKQHAQSPSALRSLRHLVSSDVRAALRKDPLLARLDKSARALVARMGSGMENRLRLGIEGPLPVVRPDPLAGLAMGLIGQQLRSVVHLPTQAGQVLGYQPPINFEASMSDFRRWYRRMHSMDSPHWELLRHLHGH
jgi:nucleoside-diphosphate-sugar epimerase